MAALANSAPPPSEAARAAQIAAALNWMLVLAVLGVCALAVLYVVLRASRPAAGRPLRGRTRGGSAWVEAGRRLKVEDAPGDEEGA